MKKILILANSDSGLYCFRKELVEKLREQHHVYICVPNGKYVEYFQSIGCEYIPIDFNRHGINPFSEIKLLKTYENILKKVRPDIVATYTIKPNVYGGMVCTKMRIPYVVNVTGLGTAVENGGIMQIITLFLYKIGLRKAQKVFFQNAENRDFMLRKGVVSGPYDLLPGSGVNLERYSLLEYPNDEAIDFVFISRVMKEKGIEQYLKAAKYIRDKYPLTKFHVCGDCEQKHYKDILNDLHNRGIIVYHGRVDDMTKIYKISNCIIHPTYYPEGMSNVLLESCACARPIITTNRAGCREIVEDGINGFVIEPKNVEDLINKIEMFICLSYDIKKQMGLAGREKVEREFDRKIVVEKYMKEVNIE